MSAMGRFFHTQSGATLRGMETRRLGQLTVSVAGLGCNNFGGRIDAVQTAAVVGAALDSGVTLFDTADLYGGGGTSEELLGRALGARRADAVITTKFGMLTPPEGLSGGSPEWVARAAEDSLRRLGTEHIDLYLIHQPDPATPIGDTLAAMNALVAAGKVREIGCSNFTGDQLDEAAAAAKERGLRPFATVQNDYSLLQREPEQEVIPACERHGMTLTPYFPLASGLLTGKYRRGEMPAAGTRLAGMPADRVERFLGGRRMDVIERLNEFAADRDHTLHELALSWLASNPIVPSVIAGATKPEQVRANAAATTVWPLTDDERAEVDALTART
jgi:aryl-alcohol dehydrogenase-like predicted oxidoreductase